MKEQEAYKAKMALQLNEWSGQIDALEASIKKAHAEIRLRRAEEMHELRAKRNLASEKMRELDKASGEAWGRTRNKADKIWADLKTGVSLAHSIFR